MAVPRVFVPKKQLPETTFAEYFDLFKIGAYLQDATKVILDRRDEKPLDILVEYFNQAQRGDHVLLRDFSFVVASQYNRSCFLQQVNRIFNSSPYYRVLSALDYHQCINLICPDFPRSLLVDACSILSVHPSATENPVQQGEEWSVISSEPRLFDRFGLEDLKAAVELFFYYSEFMEKLKSCFNELESPFSVDSSAAISLVYSTVTNAYSRNRQAWIEYPPLDLIAEALLVKVPNFPRSVLTSPEISHALQSSVSISFKELSYNLITNPKFPASIFPKTPPPESSETLLRLSKEDLLTPDANLQPAKRYKGKKKR